jgi:hypothetical protein
MSCIKHFVQEATEPVSIEMWSNDHALKKYMNLQVHRHAYNVDSRKVVSLKNYEVCLNAWYNIHSISRTNFYQFKQNPKFSE